MTVTPHPWSALQGLILWLGIVTDLRNLQVSAAGWVYPTLAVPRKMMAETFIFFAFAGGVTPKDLNSA